MKAPKNTLKFSIAQTFSNAISSKKMSDDMIRSTDKP